MSKHTPGPWWVGDKKDGYMSRTQIEPSIAIAWGAISDEEADANARLIAAAPELMEALENMVNIAERVDSYESFSSNAIEKALDVIAKAKGE